MTLYPVIMAGGSGTRFWPLSRKARPKQFLPLTSPRPLILETAQRLTGLSGLRDTFVVCGKAHTRAVRAALKRLPAKNVLVEPAARNTAPAIGLAALHVFAREPEGVLGVLPSDHHVADVAGFQRVLREAVGVAERGSLVTIGIQPTRPETGYGYIRVGAPLAGGGSRVQSFVEKPDAATAQRYLDSGEYLWNGGIFAFRADVILEAFKAHMPELWQGLEKIRGALGKRSYAAVLARTFPRLASISIDYGVMEKAQNLAVVPGSFGWSDVGSFAALPEVRAADEAGNVADGAGAILVGCEGCVVLAGKRPLAVVGLQDVVAVDAGDAILVVSREKSQEVRKVVEALKTRKLGRYL